MRQGSGIKSGALFFAWQDQPSRTKVDVRQRTAYPDVNARRVQASVALTAADVIAALSSSRTDFEISRAWRGRTSMRPTCGCWS